MAGFCAAVLLALAGCGGGDGGGGGAGGTDERAVAPPAPPASAPNAAPASLDPLFASLDALRATTSTRAAACPAYGSADLGRYECHRTEVPEDYAAPAGRRIALLNIVSRSTAPLKGTLFLLDGGPGGSGLMLARSGLPAALNAAGWDVVIPGHRGTHESALSCPVQEKAERDRASPGACLQELIAARGGGAAGAQALGQYNALNASRDVAAVQAALARGGSTVVMGISYGTYWAQRLMQLYPGLADAVVLDSSLDLRGRVEELELHKNGLLLDTLAACQDVAACRKLLGEGTPQALVQQARANIDGGQCGAGAAQSAWRSRFEPLLDSALRSREARPIAAYLIAVAAQCRAGAVAELLKLYDDVESKLEPDDGSLDNPAARTINLALYDVVKFTELVEAGSDATRANLRRITELLRDEALGARRTEGLLEALPSYTALPFNTLERRFVPSRSRVLALSAQVDIATPRQATEQMLDGMRAAGLAPEFQLFRHAGHGVVREKAGDCGFKRLMHFLDGLPPQSFACTETPIDWTLQGLSARELARRLSPRGPRWPR